jgi:phage baseplate assembly protein V
MENTQYTTQHNPPYRTAIVYALEPVAPYRVKVQFPDRDNMVSFWLPVIVPKIQEDKWFWQPDLGEQVAVLMDAFDEDGCVLGSVPSNVDQASEGLGPNIFSITFKDGTSFKYDRTLHQMTIAMGAGAAFTLTQPEGGAITMGADGNLVLQAATSITLAGASGSLTDALPLVSLLVAAFNAHTHGGPTSPGPPVSVPWTASTVASPLFKTDT